MGTLSLIFGIIFIVAGFVAFPYGLYTSLFIFALIPTAILITIGALLIKKYDRDKEKSKNS